MRLFKTKVIQDTSLYDLVNVNLFLEAMCAKQVDFRVECNITTHFINSEIQAISTITYSVDTRLIEEEY